MESNNDRYQNRYRISSIRLQNWDYGWNAIYFVTICTKGRNHYFGEIIDGRMHLSPVGAIADVLWHELSHHFGNIELDAFVVMPKTIGQQRFQHQGEKTLSSIVGSYKSAVSRHAHRLGCDFAWQSRFYDAIIRDNRALIRVQSYIGNNPKNWKEDKFCER